MLWCFALSTLLLGGHSCGNGILGVQVWFVASIEISISFLGFWVPWLLAMLVA
jgi:hypothetical protein